MQCDTLARKTIPGPPRVLHGLRGAPATLRDTSQGSFFTLTQEAEEDHVTRENCCEAAVVIGKTCFGQSLAKLLSVFSPFQQHVACQESRDREVGTDLKHSVHKGLRLSRLAKLRVAGRKPWCAHDPGFGSLR